VVLGIGSGFVYFFGSANAMISSLVTCDPVSPPPVLTTFELIELNEL
jgi:hypothetical protein